MGITNSKAHAARALVAISLVALVPASSGCGKDESSPSGEFAAKGNASTFSGPAPLAIKFRSDVRNASGDVTYSWNFGNGQKSSSPNPTYTYATRGVRNVTFRARDAKGHLSGSALIVRAYPQDLWKKKVAGTLTAAEAENLNRDLRAYHRRNNAEVNRAAAKVNRQARGLQRRERAKIEKQLREQSQK